MMVLTCLGCFACPSSCSAAKSEVSALAPAVSGKLFASAITGSWCEAVGVVPSPRGCSRGSRVRRGGGGKGTAALAALCMDCMPLSMAWPACKQHNRTHEKTSEIPR